MEILIILLLIFFIAGSCNLYLCLNNLVKKNKKEIKKLRKEIKILKDNEFYILDYLSGICEEIGGNVDEV